MEADKWSQAVGEEDVQEVSDRRTRTTIQASLVNGPSRTIAAMPGLTGEATAEGIAAAGRCKEREVGGRDGL